MSTSSLLLPHTTLQSTSFNKIVSAPPTASSSHSEQTNDKEKDASTSAIEKEKKKETEDDATMLTIPKTFAYTLSLLDCSFTKRPYPGIWQLRYVKGKLFTLKTKLSVYFVCLKFFQPAASSRRFITSYS